VIDTFIPGGWRALRSVGSNTNLQKDRTYDIELGLQGQAVRLSVDGIAVTEVQLPHPLRGDQIGLLAWGTKPVIFHTPTALSGRPRAFVVMQFAEPYNSLYKEVIKPVAENLKFDVFRADDVFRPGVILHDITRSIIDADVVIAEVTPENPNVFYELGYAHAIEKPTVLLAEHPTDPAKHLPSISVVFA
jgi:hypothetical protein